MTRGAFSVLGALIVVVVFVDFVVASTSGLIGKDQDLDRSEDDGNSDERRRDLLRTLVDHEGWDVDSVIEVDRAAATGSAGSEGPA